MKMIRNFRVIMSTVVPVVLFLILAAVSCGGPAGRQSDGNETDSASEKQAITTPATDLIRVLSPAPSDEFPALSSIRVKFEATGDAMPDSVELYFGGKLCGTVRDGSTDMLIEPTNTSATGIRALRLVAYSGDRRPQSVSMFVTILSDVVPARYGYRIERVFPHDREAYTQGLLFHKGFLYEGTGQEGKSTLRKVDLESGVVIRRLNLESRLFGEGIALMGNLVYQLTWKNRVGIIYDLESFTEVGRFYYSMEGWGLTTMGSRLVMSDGTNKLYIIDPEGFTITGSIEVYDNLSAVTYLNELEYVNGEIWANVFMSDLIARIDPGTGKVLGYIDLMGIIPANERRNDGDDVLNGIAYDHETGRIWVTGKNWPKLFQIRITGN